MLAMDCTAYTAEQSQHRALLEPGTVQPSECQELCMQRQGNEFGLVTPLVYSKHGLLRSSHTFHPIMGI